jgi:hypothetical protein
MKLYDPDSGAAKEGARFIHSSWDRPFAISGSPARFVELDSANHVLLGDEPAWPVFTRELRAFLAADDLAEA